MSGCLLWLAALTVSIVRQSPSLWPAGYVRCVSFLSLPGRGWPVSVKHLQEQYLLGLRNTGIGLRHPDIVRTALLMATSIFSTCGVLLHTGAHNSAAENSGDSQRLCKNISICIFQNCFSAIIPGKFRFLLNMTLHCRCSLITTW